MFAEQLSHNDNNDDHKHETDDDSLINIATDLPLSNDSRNQSKYITQSSEINISAESTTESTESSTESTKSNIVHYGFGKEHSHPHLSPIYDSIYDELLLNKLCSITDKICRNLLIKAIKKHKIALGSDYKHSLICKYYNKEYNIIRNEPIGVRHILALVVYTDMSTFCTKFRETYRNINNETETDVVLRHQQLYQYARSLFEAVEFFGEFMNHKLKVYHGLDKVMLFQQFTAYFNQPISTTPSLTKAHEFSKCVGIILTLKSGAEYVQNQTKIPKYLSVSWLSDFPNEEEKLFYGSYIVFQIDNIIEGQNVNIEHSAELKMFNMFQKMIQNQTVIWNDDKQTNDMVKALTFLIQQRTNDKHKNKANLEDNKYVTKYGEQLFHHFCNTQDIICIIKNFKSLPADLASSLFGRNKKKISLIPMVKLFINLREITLNELVLEQMVLDAKHYQQIVFELIQYINSQQLYGNNLIKIELKSQIQTHRKEDSVLQAIVKKYQQKLGQHHWSIKYQSVRSDDTHTLIFINNKDNELVNQYKESKNVLTMNTEIIFLSQIDEEDIVKCGYLLKESDYLGLYRERWCILTKTKMLYTFKSNSNPQQKPSKQFDLNEKYTVNLEKECSFELCLSNESIQFNAKTSQDRDQWVREIRNVDDGKKADSEKERLMTIKKQYEQLQEEIKESNNKWIRADIVKCGYLSKQSDILGWFRERWCILTKTNMLYTFKTKLNPQQKPTKQFDLNKKYTINLEKECSFELCLDNESVQFTAKTSEDRDEWVRQIKYIDDEKTSDSEKEILNEDDYKRLKDELITIKKQYEELQEFDTLKKENMRFKKTINDLQRDIKQSNKRCDNYENEINEHKEREILLLDNKKKMMKEMDTVKQENIVLMEENAKLKRQQHEYADKMSIVVGIQQQLSSAISTIKTKLNKEKEDIKHLID